MGVLSEEIKKKVCLVVDDEPIIRTYLKAVLEKEGYQTLESENAAQAFKLVQTLNGGLDLVVSDIKMPGDMDGVDLAYAIRYAFPAIPIVLVSGFVDKESTTHWTGDFGFIRKPFTLTAFLAVVNKAIAGSGRQRAASS